MESNSVQTQFPERKWREVFEPVFLLALPTT